VPYYLVLLKFSNFGFTNVVFIDFSVSFLGLIGTTGLVLLFDSGVITGIGFAAPPGFG
jgi:hypothetical protein